MNASRAIVIVVSAWVLSACSIGGARHWEAREGVVLDATTHNPIEGAIIVARWEGWISALVETSSVCYHVETAKSDTEGRFRISKWGFYPVSTDGLKTAENF